MASLEPVAMPEDLARLQEMRRQVRVFDPVRSYIADIVRATRTHPGVRYGASPRSSISLMRAAQDLAAVRNRTYVLPDDIKALARSVLSHRLILKEEEQLRNVRPEDCVADILRKTAIPTP